MLRIDREPHRRTALPSGRLPAGRNAIHVCTKEAELGLNSASSRFCPCFSSRHYGHQDTEQLGWQLLARLRHSPPALKMSGYEASPKVNGSDAAKPARAQADRSCAVWG